MCLVPCILVEAQPFFFCTSGLCETVCSFPAVIRAGLQGFDHTSAHSSNVCILLMSVKPPFYDFMCSTYATCSRASSSQSLSPAEQNPKASCRGSAHSPTVSQLRDLRVASLDLPLLHNRGADGGRRQDGALRRGRAPDAASRQRPEPAAPRATPPAQARRHHRAAAAAALGRSFRAHTEILPAAWQVSCASAGASLGGAMICLAVRLGRKQRRAV
jgi:hypothetical protein